MARFDFTREAVDNALCRLDSFIDTLGLAIDTFGYQAFYADSIEDKIAAHRKGLHLSEEYVAKLLGMNVEAYRSIENGYGCFNSNEIEILENVFLTKLD